MLHVKHGDSSIACKEVTSKSKRKTGSRMSPDVTLQHPHSKPRKLRKLKKLEEQASRQVNLPGKWSK